MKFCNTLLAALIAFFILNLSETRATTDFGNQIVIDNSSNGGITVATADFNNDGFTDILTGSGSGLKWHQNNGKGNFIVKHSAVTLTTIYYKVEAVDFDGDGAVDIVVNNSYNTLEWYKNDGSGNFGPAIFIINMDAVFNTQITDIDGDGHLDILIPDYINNAIKWYKNNGAMQFGLAQTITNQVFSPWMAKSADLDGDGDLDIISSSVSDDKIAIYKNLGDGIFGNQVVISYELNDPELVYAFDLDQDGDQDIIAGSWLDPRILWFENDGNGNFGSLGDYNVITSTVEGIQSIHAADLDKDGDLDLMIAALVNNNLSWYENFGNGHFGPKNTITENISEPHLVTCADIDHDFDVDILAASTIDNKVTLYTNIKEFIGTGVVFNDINQNGIKDNDEQGIGNQMISIDPYNQMTTSYFEGNFKFDNHNDTTYTIKWVPDNNWTLTTGGAAQMTLPSQTSEPVSFGLIAANTVHDIQPSITSQPTRCNTIVPFYATIANEGTQIESGVAELIIDGNISMVYYSPSNINMNNNTWEFQNIWPGNEQVISMHMSVPTPEFIGDSINMTLNVYSTDLAGNYIDTTSYNYTTVIRCSYDPNDKQVEPKGIEEEHFTLIDETLYYTVRFQNTGNDYAYNVAILDTLDANLDITTLKIVSSSHSVVTDIDVANRAVEFSFDDIMLPDSTTDLIGSQGYILYHIKPLEDVIENTLVENTAHILFDQNPGIVTNTTFNTLVEHLPDYLAPIAYCADSVEVFLDKTGFIELNSALINQNSTDNLGISHFELNETYFNCYDIGYHELNMTVFDFGSNSDYCTSILKVTDNKAPILECKEATFNIVDDVSVVLTYEDIVRHIEDNCEVTEIRLSQKEFTSEDAGEQTITVFAKDASGNESSSEANIKVSVITTTKDPISNVNTTIYPNPFFETAILELNDKLNSTYHVTMRDVSGKVVRNYNYQSGNQLEIKKGELSKGVYFVTVDFDQSDVNPETIQLIVQ